MVRSLDEIGELAEAFVAVHRSAVTVAVEQALMRRNVNAMFVNLARRSQVLVERQLELLDDLEREESDPDQLENLFKLDHLAARMRRNDESLLVLAGTDSTRRWNRPVGLGAVLLAAAAEIEQYQRVRIESVADVHMVGHAVGELVHLLAELLENATAFSRPDTSVVVTARVDAGGALIEIVDRGLGMSPTALARRTRCWPARRPRTSRRWSGWVSSSSATWRPGWAYGCGWTAARAAWSPGSRCPRCCWRRRARWSWIRPRRRGCWRRARPGGWLRQPGAVAAGRRLRAARRGTGPAGGRSAAGRRRAAPGPPGAGARRGRVDPGRRSRQRRGLVVAAGPVRAGRARAAGATDDPGHRRHRMSEGLPMRVPMAQLSAVTRSAQPTSAPTRTDPDPEAVGGMLSRLYSGVRRAEAEDTTEIPVPPSGGHDEGGRRQ